MTREAEAYRAHLLQRSGASAVDDRQLHAVLTEVTSSPVVRKQRVVAGEANEVYDINFANGLAVIVRITTGAVDVFAREQWAVDACVSVGVPCPNILLRRSIVHETPLHFCVQEKAAGQLLADWKQPNPNFSLTEREQLTNQAGDLLSRIHTVPTDGFGYLDGQGKGESAAGYGDGYAAILAQMDHYAAVGRRTGLPAEVAAVITRTLEDASALREQPPRLVHNDFLPKHLFAQSNKITAVIDWGEAAGDHPVGEFAKWSVRVGDAFPLDWLKAGYANRSLFDDDFEARLWIHETINLLCELDWYSQTGFVGGVVSAKQKLIAKAR